MLTQEKGRRGKEPVLALMVITIISNNGGTCSIRMTMMRKTLTAVLITSRIGEKMPWMV